MFFPKHYCLNHKSFTQKFKNSRIAAHRPPAFTHVVSYTYALVKQGKNISYKIEIKNNKN